MDIEKLNQNPPPHAHKILWSILAVLLLVVIVGSVYWWQEIKQTPATQISCKEEVTAGCNKTRNLEVFFKKEATEIEVITFWHLLEKQSWADSVVYFSAKQNEDEFKKLHADSPSIIAAADELDDSENLFKASLVIRLTSSDESEKASEFIKSQAIYSKVETVRNTRRSDPDTTEWKTYTNAEYGFEFKYPNNLYQRSEKGAVFNVQNTPMKLEFGGMLSGESENGVEGKDFVTSGYQFYVITDQDKITSIDYTFYDSVDFRLGGVIASEYFSNDGISNGTFVLIDTPSSQQIIIGYSAVCSDRSVCNIDDVNKLYNQILSTFKFTSKATLLPIETKPDNCLTRGECMLNKP